MRTFPIDIFGINPAALSLDDHAVTMRAINDCMILGVEEPHKVNVALQSIQ